MASISIRSRSMPKKTRSQIEHGRPMDFHAAANDSRQSSQVLLTIQSGDRKSAHRVRVCRGTKRTVDIALGRTGNADGLAELPQYSQSASAKSLSRSSKTRMVCSSRRTIPEVRMSPDQTLEQTLSAKNPDMKDGCPSVKDLKKISQLTTNITPSPGELPKDCPWGGEDFQPRCWAAGHFHLDGLRACATTRSTSKRFKWSATDIRWDPGCSRSHPAPTFS